jgi:hypothetical protein
MKLMSLQGFTKVYKGFLHRKKMKITINETYGEYTRVWS